MSILNEEIDMTKFDVRVNSKDSMYCESFILFGISKVHAMKRGIELARKCDNVKGELHATARVVRD
jgi:hypothetical protein